MATPDGAWAGLHGLSLGHALMYCSDANLQLATLAAGRRRFL